MKLKTLLACIALMGSAAAAPYAQAAVAPYAHVGVYNATTYTFTAPATGDLIGYFAGMEAVYDNMVGVLDNGVQTSGGFGLDNQTSKIGQKFNFGMVTAGDTLTFELYNKTLGMIAYSNAAMNVAYDDSGVAGHNHIYSTQYAGGDPNLAGVPNGTFVGFEDQRFPYSDYDYNDEQFVFTDTQVASTPERNPVSGAPEPSAWMLMIAGVGMAGAALRSSRWSRSVATA